MAVTKVLNLDGVKTLWDKIKGMFLPLDGGTVTGAITSKSNIVIEGLLLKKTSDGKNIFNASTTSVNVGTVPLNANGTLKVTGNVGIGVAVPTNCNLQVKDKASIPTVYTQRIDMTSGDGIIIGDDANSGFIKFSTDMQGINLDGYDSSTMDEPDVGWQLSTMGNMSLVTLTASSAVTTKDITITNALYTNINGTRYKLDVAKAISLGLLVKG